MNLKNKIVVITGGTKGLGKAMAMVFLENEAKVIVCSRDDKRPDDLEGNIFWVKADVTKEEELKNLAYFVVEKFGKIDIWINNAGIWLPHMPIEEIDWGKRAHDLIEVNLFGTVYGSKIALAQMRKQNSGLIINILSTSALNGLKNETAYCASKFAASGFTKALMKEVDRNNIKVNAIYPGGMQTNLFDERKPEIYNTFMDPNEVAEKIVENLKKDKPEEELIIKR
ncbi:MAG: SDR family NAD(P)-dependent oxidoreductase [Candidatus Nomurabacteria bacterium]|nr:SDR family NAD(P)-dependent oxidoreductase [Candidatus Nomurabacteria bacterium]